MKYTASFVTLAGWGCDVDEDATITFNKSCVSNSLQTVELITENSAICQTVFPAITFRRKEICARTTYQRISLVINFENSTKCV